MKDIFIGILIFLGTINFGAAQNLFSGTVKDAQTK